MFQKAQFLSTVSLQLIYFVIIGKPNIAEMKTRSLGVGGAPSLIKGVLSWQSSFDIIF